MDKFLHSSSSPKSKRLGDSVMTRSQPLNEELFKSIFTQSEFQKKSICQRLDELFRALLSQMMAIKEPVFLLPQLVRLFDGWQHEKYVGSVHFSYFELWLNQFSGLSTDENYKVRGQICGKYLPRDYYQTYFPIGQNKTYFGSHFVTAHSSPDLDTSVASFWGWIDAFGARISEGLHHWNVPSGAPTHQVEFKLIFDEIFSPYLLSLCTRSRSALQGSSLELITQKDMVKCSIENSSLSIDLEKNQQAVILVDAEGYYQGDWRTADVEGVRQVVMLVNQMLRHFENRFQQELIALFAKEDLKKSDLKPFIASMLAMKLSDAEPLKELSERQRKHVTDYLIQVLHIPHGLDANIHEMAKGFNEIKVTRFENFISLVQGQLIEKLFDAKGELTASRSVLFKTLDQIIGALDEAIHMCRRFVDQLKVSLEIKAKVFGYKPLYVSEKADIEELRAKMGNSAYLTVTVSDERGQIPIGVVYASDLYKPMLSTVTLRDFSNRDETKIPSYMEVISVIDHHKLQLSGTTPATIYIADVQSANVILAELAFSVNDRLSSSGMTKESLLKQYAGLQGQNNSSAARRILLKLLQKLEAIDKRGAYYIDPSREYIEYLHFLFAILDDTDLLSKVTRRDVEVVKELINRMKTLSVKEEVEVVHFDDISQNSDFVQTAAARLLKNADLFSMTQKIYEHKERFIEDVIQKAALKQDLLFYADTKEQNGCVRIGQFKLYPSNYACFRKYASELQSVFLEESKKVAFRKKEVDLHIFMISTLCGVEGIFEEKDKATRHEDEIWVYIPEDCEGGVIHLRSFLNNFGASQGAIKAVKSVSVMGPQAKELGELIATTSMQSLGIQIASSVQTGHDNLVIIKVVAGSMNSRKAMISPFLPKLVV